MMRHAWSLHLLLAILAFFSLAQPAQAAICSIGESGQTVSVPISDSGRSMLVHVPAGYDGNRPLPLLFLLHGSTATGAEMLRGSGLTATSDRHVFLLAAPDGGIPEGEGFVWNIPGVPTVTGAIPGPSDADDVLFIKAAMDRLVAQGCVDPARIYATGLSGGGRMASWLGCVASDRLAAIAPVVGLRAGRQSMSNPDQPDPDSCKPDHSMPILAFAGGMDRTNPINGGAGARWGYGMHAAEQRWAALNRCKQAPTTSWIAPGIYEEYYGGCANGAEVRARVTTDAGHSWVADNEALWQFLSRHRREPLRK